MDGLEKKTKDLVRGLFLVVLFCCVVMKLDLVRRILGMIYSAVAPLIYGCMVAFVLNLIVNFLEKGMKGKLWKNRTVKRGVSITISIVLLVGVITILCMCLVPEVVNSTRQLGEKVPVLVDQTLEFGERHLGLPENAIEKIKDIKINGDMLEQMVGLIENQSVMAAIRKGGSFVTNFITVLADFGIGFFFAFYLLMRKEELASQAVRLIKVYLPHKIGEKILHLAKMTNQVYAGFISGQCVDAIILGMMMTLVMLIFRLSYPVLIGVIVAVTALVPVVGAFIGCIVGMFLLFIESPVGAVTFLVLFLVIQQIDNKLIYPHVVGSAVGLPSIWIFAAIIVGGKISGVAGMFLGIPFAALLYTLIKEDVHRREGQCS